LRIRPPALQINEICGDCDHIDCVKVHRYDILPLLVHREVITMAIIVFLFSKCAR
jgi:hypothetical protein